MSQYLRDLAKRKFSKASMLMQKGKHKEALVELQEAEEAAHKTKANDILLHVLSTKGYIVQTLGAYEEALKIYSLILKTTEELLSKDPDNELYHSIF
jgi:tetratricopeptide (TPR) repeat protein